MPHNVAEKPPIGQWTIVRAVAFSRDALREDKVSIHLDNRGRNV